MTVHELVSKINDATHVYLYQNGLLLCKYNKRDGNFYNDWKVHLIWTYRNRIEVSITP